MDELARAEAVRKDWFAPYLGVLGKVPFLKRHPAIAGWVSILLLLLLLLPFAYLVGIGAEHLLASVFGLSLNDAGSVLMIMLGTGLLGWQALNLHKLIDLFFIVFGVYLIAIGVLWLIGAAAIFRYVAGAALFGGWALDYYLKRRQRSNA
jgi:hypothetical protein